MDELAVILPSFFDPRKPKISRAKRKPRTNFIKIKRGLPLRYFQQNRTFLSR
jgi:hypothetical protein